MGKEALSVLSELGQALKSKNGDKFDDAYKRLNGLWSALAQNDFEKILSRVISEDPPTYQKFLEDRGIDTGMEKKEQKREGVQSARPVPMPQLYTGFRLGGLGYGPRFRCCGPYKKMTEDGCLGVVQLQDCSDDWERELGYSSS